MDWYTRSCTHRRRGSLLFRISLTPWPQDPNPLSLGMSVLGMEQPFRRAVPTYLKELSFLRGGRCFPSSGSRVKYRHLNRCTMPRRPPKTCSVPFSQATLDPEAPVQHLAVTLADSSGGHQQATCPSHLVVRVRRAPPFQTQPHAGSRLLSQRPFPWRQTGAVVPNFSAATARSDPLGTKPRLGRITAATERQPQPPKSTVWLRKAAGANKRKRRKGTAGLAIERRGLRRWKRHRTMTRRGRRPW